MRVYGITGWKNTGKTTLAERLVAELVWRGLSISTIKHAHHATDVDHPGRDSYRHRQAGAGQVIVASPERWALMTELRGQEEPPLEALLAQLAPCDLVLVEGFKRGFHPKVEAHRAAVGRPLLAPENPTIRALATDTPLDHPLPQFDLNDVPRIADFILSEVGL